MDSRVEHSQQQHHPALAGEGAVKTELEAFEEDLEGNSTLAGLVSSPSGGELLGLDSLDGADLDSMERLPPPAVEQGHGHQMMSCTPMLEDNVESLYLRDEEHLVDFARHPGDHAFPMVKLELDDLHSFSCVDLKLSSCAMKFDEDERACIKLELEDDNLYDELRLGSPGIVLNDDPLDGDLHPGILNALRLPDSMLDMGTVEALDAGEVHDGEIGEEEALLLAEVAKVEEESMDRESSLCSSKQSSVVTEASEACSRPVDKAKAEQASQSSLDQPSKNSKNGTSSRRKVKVDWTPELHRRFVQAVEQLGVEKAIPSRILELMGVQCLTRHNIASHLQKYRSHRRHLLAREAEAATWHHRRPIDPTSWTRSRRDGTAWVGAHHGTPTPIQPRPPMGLTPIQPHPGPHPTPMAPLHVWGHPTVDHSTMHMWQQPQMAAPTAWQAPDGTYWQHPVAYGQEAWTHGTPALGTPCYPQPMMRYPMTAVPAMPHMTAPTLCGEGYFADESMPVPMYPTTSGDADVAVAAGAAASSKPHDFHPPKELLDAAISEALSNPYTPLPLGLKPPSMDSVMAELQRQGINSVPPPASR